MKAKNKNYCRDAREEIREHGGSPMADGLPMGVPFGVGPPVGSSGKLSSPTDIKRSPLRGRPAALDLLWYFLFEALCGVGLPVPLHLGPRAVPPQRLSLKATLYITALSCRDGSIRLSSCKAIFCKKSRKIGTGFST